MKRFLWLAGLFVLAQVAAATEGKGIPVWERSLPDTFYGTEQTVSRYADSNGLARILAARDNMDPRVDTAAKVVRFEFALVKTRQDSAGLPVQLVTTTRAVGGTYQGLNLVYFRYDALGRKIAIIQTRGDTSEGWDTTRWVWTHEGCADEYHSGERQIWSVNAQGRCSTAVVLSPNVNGTDTSWSDFGRRRSLLWNGNVLVRQTESDGSGPYSVEQDSIVSDSLVAGVKYYDRSSMYGKLNLWSEATYSYSGSRISSSVIKAYDTLGQVEILLEWATSRPANLGIVRSLARPASVTARREGAALRFANTGSEAVEIDVSTVRGQRVGALHVESGREALLPVTKSATMLVWSAKGRTANARGTVLPGI
jgi:hypothetical protein